VAVPSAPSRVLRVEATFIGAGTTRLAIPFEAHGRMRPEEKRGDAWVALGTSGDEWDAPSCTSRCTVRYAIDLDDLASACHGDLDCALGVGGGVVGPASAWLLRPEPRGDASATMHIRGGDASTFATGLRRAGADGRTFAFRGWELGEGSFTAFGPMRRARVEHPGALLDIAMLGTPLAMGDDATRAWIAEASGTVASFFGRFPVDATLFVVPVHGADEVVFGRVLSLTGASVIVLAGDQLPVARTHEDWVLVLELFHLGSPSFMGEGHWLEEGLATYYEPILRARAGWLSAAELWQHFATEMPRGLRGAGRGASLEERDDIDSTYWGGALFAFACDVRIREQTRGAHSLDEVMRAVLARGGDATHVWRVADVARIGDEVTGTRVMRDALDHIAVRGEAVDFGAMMRDLGIAHAGDTVDLRSDAKLASVRDAIASGK
jgi:hypothetical protein